VARLLRLNLGTAVNDAKAGHAPKIRDVERYDAETVRYRSRGDPEVVRTEDFSATGELGPYLCVDSGDPLGDRHRLERREQVLDECSPPRPNRAARAMHAV
jgi:hypothetical protein